MSDDPARALSGLRILVLDQDRARGDALSSLLREAGAEAGTVPEGVEPQVVIAEAVPDGIVIDRASPAVDPIRLRATLESDTFLRSIVIVPGVLGEAAKDGAMALKRLVTVRLSARLALARNLESGNEAEGSVTDVGPSAIVRLGARAPYNARIEVTTGPRLITVSTADGLLLGVTEASAGKVTQRGLDALAALLSADGGKFRISKETKGPIGNLVGEPDEHLRNAAAMSRRATNRPPAASSGSAPAPRMPSASPAASAGGAPTGAPPARDPALGRTLHMASPTPTAGTVKPASQPAPPAAPRAVVSLSENPRPLGRTLVGVAVQPGAQPASEKAGIPASPSAPARPSPAVSPAAPRVGRAPVGAASSPQPAASPQAAPTDPLPIPREPLPIEARPGPIRSKTLLGMAAPTIPGRATLGGPPPAAPASTTPVLDPITSKIETPADVLVRAKTDDLDDDVITDRVAKAPVRVPAPPASGDADDGRMLTDSGGDLPTVIGPRPDVIASIADAIPSPHPSVRADAVAPTAKSEGSPSVVPVRNIVIDDAVTIPKSRVLPEVPAPSATVSPSSADAPPILEPSLDEAVTIPRAARKPDAAPMTARESLAHAATIMALPTPAKAPPSPAAAADSATASSVTGEMAAPSLRDDSSPRISTPAVTAEMEMPPPRISTPSVTAEMEVPSVATGKPTSTDPLGATWAAPRASRGPDIGRDEWTDGGGPPNLDAARPRAPEPQGSRFPVAAVVAVVLLGGAVGVGAMWALKVGPFAVAPPAPVTPAPTEPAPPDPTQPATPTPPDPTQPGTAATDDAGAATEATADAGATAATPPTPPTPPSSNPPESQGSSEGGDDTSGLRDAQQALARGDVAGAQSAMSRLSGRERSSPHGESLQSQIAERQGDLDGAIAHARRASSMRPGRSSYRTRLGDLLMRAGAAGAARSEYEAALRTNPRDQNARRALERMGVAPPPEGGGTPSGGGTDSPPSSGTDSPPSGGTDSPPSGGTDSPPSGGTDSPPSGGTDSPPPPPPPSPDPPPAPPADPPGGTGGTTP